MKISQLLQIQLVFQDQGKEYLPSYYFTLICVMRFQGRGSIQVIWPV